jgi:hypothetical protein
MDSKYYTPDIEDLFVGYECETWYSYDRKIFEPDIIDGKWQLDFLKQYINDGALRTKYLTKEQIESEGWKFISSGTKRGHCFYKKKYDLYFDNELGTVKIKNDKEDISYEVESGIKYDGQCPSINEFRKICKWVGV